MAKGWQNMSGAKSSKQKYPSVHSYIQTPQPAVHHAKRSGFQDLLDDELFGDAGGREKPSGKETRNQPKSSIFEDLKRL